MTGRPDLPPFAALADAIGAAITRESARTPPLHLGTVLAAIGHVLASALAANVEGQRSRYRAVAAVAVAAAANSDARCEEDKGDATGGEPAGPDMGPGMGPGSRAAGLVFALLDNHQRQTGGRGFADSLSIAISAAAAAISEMTDPGTPDREAIMKDAAAHLIEAVAACDLTETKGEA